MLRRTLHSANTPVVEHLLLRARVHQNRDDCEAAENLYLQALEAAEAEAGSDALDLVPILDALAGLLRYVERHDEATGFANRAIELNLPRQPGSGLVH